MMTRSFGPKPARRLREILVGALARLLEHGMVMARPRCGR